MTNRKQILAAALDFDGISQQEIADMITIPADASKGDYCLPCFKLAKTLRKSPVQIAEEAAGRLTCLPPPFKKAEAVNGYLNFFVDTADCAKQVLTAIEKKGASYGDSNEGEGKTVCIDYSSINIAKPFHIGHLCTTVIGGALYCIYKKLGYTPVGINHLGDWGTQFGKLIVAFKKWSSEEALHEKGMTELTSIYVRFHTEAETDPTLEDQARAWFKKIEDGDEEALRLYNLFKEITLKEVEKTYKRLKIKFDSYNGEAFYNDKMQPVLDELKEKGLLKKDDGAEIVDLSDDGMPPCLLVKADGATLYATRDLAAAYYRKKTYDFYKSLYVVAYQQNLHFRQVFKVLEKLGKEWAKDCVHVAFGMVSMESGAMSTRKGKVIYLEDVLNKAVEKSYEIINEKSPQLENKEETAEMVGVGAVIFSVLYNNRIKDIVFSYDKVLNFDGETGPYVQYTNARCLSVLNKVGKCDAVPDFSAVDNAEGQAVIALLERFPSVLRESVEKYEPCCIGRFLVDLCKSYNRFYLVHRITGEAEQVKKARAMLTNAVHTVLEEGLRLMGIDAPKKM